MPLDRKDRRNSSSIRDKGRFEKMTLLRVIFDLKQMEPDTILRTHVLFGRSKGFLMIKGRGQGEESGIIMFDHG